MASTQAVRRTVHVLIVSGILAAGAILFAATPAHGAEVLYSGDCGPTSSWTLDEDKVLTISGTGEVCKWGYNKSYSSMENFAHKSSGTGSGYRYMKHEATSIVVEEGITSIGEDVFNYYTLVTSVSLPSTLETIDAKAFYNCRKLSSLSFGDEPIVTSLGDESFALCRALTSFTLPASVTSIGAQAFATCDAMESFKVESGSALTSVGDGAFDSCSVLKSLNLRTATKLKTVGKGVLNGVPAATPTVKKLSVKKGGKLTVSWSTAPGATKYVVYYKQSGKYSSVAVPASKTSTTIAKLATGKKCTVYVVAQLIKTKLGTSKTKTSAKIK